MCVRAHVCVHTYVWGREHTHLCVFDLKGEVSLSKERKLKMGGKRQRKSRGDIVEEECTPGTLSACLKMSS